jgi:acyl-CoA thioesterase-2
MGDLAIDTELRALGESRYAARMSRDWEIWGPMGGYLAAYALRAAGAHCALPRPASIVGHYLGVGDFDQDIEIHCETRRAAKTARSVRATISQGGRALFDALVWGVTDQLAGLDHHDAAMPDVPHWRDCPTQQERLAARGEESVSRYRFWGNLEARPPAWRDDWLERTTGDAPPEWHEWLRFLPTATFADRWLDACRLLILVDLGSWPAVQAYHNQSSIMAPSIDIACEFHRIDTAAEWLFMQGHSPSAAQGLIGAHIRVWNDDRVLLASGVSQLLCRPVPDSPT